MGSYLRHHRKNSGLSQRELAEVVGSSNVRQVSRHEKFTATPSLFAAVGYQVALNVSIAELFPGVYESVRQGVEERLFELERRLEQSSPKGRKAMEETAAKLVWIQLRRQQLGPSSKDGDVE